jgi:hypothetical protein
MRPSISTYLSGIVVGVQISPMGRPSPLLRFLDHPLVHPSGTNAILIRPVCHRPPDNLRNLTNRLSHLGLANNTQTLPGSFPSHASTLADLNLLFGQWRSTWERVILTEPLQNQHLSSALFRILFRYVAVRADLRRGSSGRIPSFVQTGWAGLSWYYIQQNILLYTTKVWAPGHQLPLPYVPIYLSTNIRGLTSSSTGRFASFEPACDQWSQSASYKLLYSNVYLCTLLPSTSLPPLSNQLPLVTRSCCTQTQQKVLALHRCVRSGP